MSDATELLESMLLRCEDRCEGGKRTSLPGEVEEGLAEAIEAGERRWPADGTPSIWKRHLSTDSLMDSSSSERPGAPVETRGALEKMARTAGGCMAEGMVLKPR